MRQSQLFTKIERNAPKDEATVNAQLLARAGFVSKLMSGVYSYLPLGLRTLNKIENIVREEMDAVGGQEISMPMIHPKANWTTTGGWDNIDVLFKVKSRTEKDYALGQSEEEVVTPLVMKYLKTYKDLPKAVYQINWKFRDELRSKSGLLRGVEFLMKDMYSFHETQEDFECYFAEVKKAYFKIFDRLGLVAKATEASGGAFTQKISYEFMVLTDAGEDDILYCDTCEFCVNVEIAKEKEGDKCTRCNKGTLAKAKASEVGNVFDLGQKFAKDFEVTFADKEGKKQYPIMGCYGIGISRLMGVIVEKYNDESGILWPESVAPFAVHLLALGAADGSQIYESLQTAGVQVLYDDRDVTPGAKFAEADLIGIPWRIVVSQKLQAEGGDKVELKKRSEKEAKIVTLEEALKIIKKS
jgi:prolyl-tRNA synthetase